MSDLKEKIGGFEKTPLFTFAKPYLDFIEQGKLYGITYIIMAVANLLMPFIAIIYAAVRLRIFNYMDGGQIVGCIFVWLFIVFAAWISFQLWWDRKNKITVDLKDSEFIVIPFVAELIRVFGEMIATYLAVVGVGFGIFGGMFISSEYFIAIIAGPVGGFAAILFFRLLAEGLRIFAALANNTKEIANNIKNK